VENELMDLRQVFTAVDDLLFFLVGSLEENELILTTILTTYMEALSLIFK